MGKVVATGTHIYLPHLVCVDRAPAGVPCNATTGHWVLYVATSTDRGLTFVDRALPAAPIGGAEGNGLSSVWPISLAADHDGHAAVGVSGAAHVWLWTSRDAGVTWTRRAKPVDDGSDFGGATVPSVAIAGSRVIVAYYASAARSVGARHAWYGVVADSPNSGTSFTSVAIPAVLATTDSPELGDELYDNFGTTITRAGSVAVVMTESCGARSPTDVECPGPGTGLTGSAANREVLRWALITRRG
jgi:hypothetical protein